jgi:ubiquinone biosynthesis protein
MKILEVFKFFKAVKRIREVSFIFIKHGFYQFIISIGLSRYFIFKKYLKRAYSTSDTGEAPPEVRLRFVLEELGPTFIKLGQMASQEISMLPPQYINELKNLQDNVRLNYAENFQIKELIKKDLNKNIDDIFLEFNEVPIASASIAQVHKAVLKDGTEVAVKIKKPDAAKIIKEDLNVLYFILKIIRKPAEELFYIDNIDELYNEFSKNIKTELNFLQEAGYTDRIRNSNINKETVVIPKIFREYSTESILVEEFIEGIKISDKNELVNKGYDLKKILDIFLEYFFNQIFLIGSFNADPHPGNIFVINNSTIGVIDHGLIGNLTKNTRQKALNYLINFLKEDYELAANDFMEICLAELSEKEEQNFKHDLMEFIDSVSIKPFKELYSAELLLETLKIARRHRIVVPSELSLLFKALLSIESIAKILDPDFTFRRLNFYDFAEGKISNEEKVKSIKESFFEKLKDYGDFIADFPKKGEKILRKMSEDNFSIEFIHKGLEGLINEIEKASKRLVLGLLLVALIISSTILMFLGSSAKMGWMETMGTVGWIVGMLYLFVILIKGLDKK